MTMLEFAFEFRALLRKAEDSGLDVEQFCQLAESIMETGWDKDSEGIEPEIE